MSEADFHPTTIMEMSDQIDAIAKVLPKAQASMGEVFKTANNPAFRSKYADLSAVVEAVVPALNQHGISLLQPSSFNGEMVTVATMLLHESGQWVRCSLSVPLTKRDAHGVGSAVTYGRRFGLQAMSGVAPVDDDGNAAAHRGPPPEAKRTEPAAPTLSDRADRLMATMRAVKSVSELDKAFTLASALCADLRANAPGKLAEIEALRAAREEEFAAERIAA